MDKKIMIKARKMTLSTNRLHDNVEQYPVDWLLKNVDKSGYISNIDMIRDAILCMDPRHDNYRYLNDEDKAKADSLQKNPEIVDHVLVTLFQWFGTTVGKHTIGKLLDDIRALEQDVLMSHK